MKKTNDTEANNMLATGLFNLQEFHGWPINVVNTYFKEKGWQVFDCFNDYKRAWVNHSLNKSIVAKTEMVDNDVLGNEIVVDIWWYDGIYSEPLYAIKKKI
jgi:hypothetical protein